VAKHGYHDLGRKPEEPEKVSDRYYPSLSFTTEELPDLEGKDVGDIVNLQVVGEIKGLRKEKEGTCYDIELRKASVGKLSKEEYDQLSDEEKDKYDEEEVMSRE
jgi:hypothetical protein